MVEARAKKLKEELQFSLENVWDLESQIKDHEEQAVKRKDYISLLENKFSNATSKVMVFEVQLKVANLKV